MEREERGGEEMEREEMEREERKERWGWGEG